MLLNHTSGIAEYLPYAFPSLQGFPSDPDVSSLDDNTFRQFSPEELIDPPRDVARCALGLQGHALCGDSNDQVEG